MKKLFASVFILAMVACGTAKVGLTQADADRGAQKFPGLTLSALNQGQADAETFCSKCHQYKKPQTRTEEQWKEIVPRMAKKNNSGIDEKTQQSILSYYVTMSK